MSHPDVNLNTFCQWLHQIKSPFVVFLVKQAVCIGYAGDVYHRAGGRGNKHYMVGAQQRMNSTFFLQNHPKYHEAIIRQEARRLYLNPELNIFVDGHLSAHLNNRTGIF